MTTAALTANMIAVSERSKAKILGYLVWFSVPDRAVGLKRLSDEWQLAGLDARPLPKMPRPKQVFMRAMRAQEGKVKLSDGTIVETDVKDVVDNEEVCVYQISRVVRDKVGKRVRYPAAMRVTYDKRIEEITGFDKLGSEVTRADLEPMEDAIADFFDKNAKKIDGRKVRTVVREFLSTDDDDQPGVIGLGGENMRGKAGGVYFVPVQYAEQLAGLSEALEALYKDEAAFLSAVPLADSATEKELIRRQHVANIKAEMQEAIKEAAECIRREKEGSRVRSDSKKFQWERLRTLQRHADRYRGLLQEDTEDVVEQQDILRQQLEKLTH